MKTFVKYDKKKIEQTAQDICRHLEGLPYTLANYILDISKDLLLANAVVNNRLDFSNPDFEDLLELRGNT